jgi:transposase
MDYVSEVCQWHASVSAGKRLEAVYGIELSRSTLANWIIYCADHYLDPLYDFFHRKLLEREFLMADETTVQVLNESGCPAQSKSYMWLYRSGEDGLPTIILYGYSKTRAGENAKDFLSGFQGYLECDGYQGYNMVPSIKRCCCWAHVRRYLIDAVPKGKQYDYSNPAVQGVGYCNTLFAYEAEINKKKCSFEERYKLRLQKEKPVLEAFWSWLDEQHPVRNTRMDKAVTYIQNRREFLETYLEDGRCSFSNNLSENAIRPFTIGRKNWLFSESTGGAKASATVYSIVEMAKAHDLNIYKYLNFLLEQRPSKDMTDEQLELLAPWNQNVIDSYKQ